MPLTAFTFLVGTLAICGIPPFAGFWSKDEILGLTFEASPLLWVIGWLTAGITAFYMFRMYFSTFEGEFRGNDMALRGQLRAEAIAVEAAPSFGPGAMDPHELEHSDPHDDPHGDPHGDHGHSHEPHESPWSMTLPLLTLAIPSALLGLVGMPFHNLFAGFIHAPGEVMAAGEHAFDWVEFGVMAGNSVGIALLGITLASFFYLRKTIDPAAIAAKIQPLYRFSLNKWYFDELYDRLFVQGSRRLARQVMEVDFRIVDGAVNLTGFLTLVSGEGLKYFENGRAQFYALIVFGAVLGLVIVSGIT
jgi:NAD(P)H-quinone oxidoreductase subunit 5